MRIRDCPECMAHLHASSMLVEACASVGISRGQSTQRMLVVYLSGYHARGHKAEGDE